MTLAPDYCEPLIGWRAWRAVRRGGETYLTSIFHRARWPWGEPLAGRCERPRAPWRRHPRHPPPALDCLCGIHASTLPVACSYAPVPGGRYGGYAVVGTVAVWGDVAEHADGWRASLAYPNELYLLCPRRSPDLGAIKAATQLERYDVPVTTLDAGRRTDVAALLHGLPELRETC